MSVYKAIRFFSIYGFFRTLIKVSGRTRKKFLKYFFIKLIWKKKANISLIGCGQFGFTTISYFLYKFNGNHFLECFDIDLKNQKSTSDFWGYSSQDNVLDLLNNPRCDYVYIASNHASHTDYAFKALQAGKTVYIEKPVSVNYDQFRRIFGLIKETPIYRHKVFIGYNRPFSPAIIRLNTFFKGSMLPITLNCFVIGHFIEKNHWYRNFEEGTRICGNVGHWIDLSINLLNTRGKIPEVFRISVSFSNVDEIDDNLAISIVTEFNDLITIVISSREEPFEGINESIQFQSGNIIAKIDDFRKIFIWDGRNKISSKFFPKDVGHLNAINQPFNGMKREFIEIEISTVIMLEIAEMVRNNESYRLVEPNSIIKKELNSII
jgi:predicted dehydrogenase